MITRSFLQMSSRPFNFSQLLGSNWDSEIIGYIPFNILLHLSFISFSPWDDYFMPFPFTSYRALIFFHSFSVVDFVSYFVERINVMIRKLNRKMHPGSLLSFLFPGKGIPFQLEFVVVKFLRLSNWWGPEFLQNLYWKTRIRVKIKERITAWNLATKT